MNKLQDTGSLAVVEAIDKLEMLYDAALAALRDAISAFIVMV
ncbi:AMP nucleosidase, partial [Yersinia pestis]